MVRTTESAGAAGVGAGTTRSGLERVATGTTFASTPAGAVGVEQAAMTLNANE